MRMTNHIEFLGAQKPSVPMQRVQSPEKQSGARYAAPDHPFTWSRPLATPNYAYEKRQRELAKKRKAEEKRQRKITHKPDDAAADAPADEAAAQEQPPAQRNGS
jgi:hypothetical protein